MIGSFACKETEKIYNGKFSKKLDHKIQQRALAKLAYMDAATDLLDLSFPPSNRLHQLAGDRAGQHAIRINEQYRICFTWNDNKELFTEVEITDYH